MVAAAFTTIEPELRASFVDWYRTRGTLRFAYAAGSLVEGLADTGDIDVTIVWDQVPDEAGRAPAELADEQPAPATFHLPNFKLDRFFVDGQQIDVKHVSATEFGDWVAAVEAGGGTSGYPMPVIVLHGFSVGVILADDELP